MIGEAQAQIDKMRHDLDGETTASQSDNEANIEYEELFFSLEEIELMSEGDRMIYINKLLVDH